MHLDLSGLLLAGSMWMLAAVVVWPWGYPAIAAALLIGQAVGFIALAIWAASVIRASPSPVSGAGAVHEHSRRPQPLVAPPAVMLVPCFGSGPACHISERDGSAEDGDQDRRHDPSGRPSGIVEGRAT
ncbi:hypothetical protein [Geodermatophilus ruber]|uniref:Uncharacterized protein n=1 Tax=Geodermatophilus ruber TaxID=504800 RepID=A0A1I4A5D7_9ACTN|nr:hypothetical protein [Geodermatophilus ruber]SFK51131.1 hypothetical protein SAMN04488085_10267 [Geodermatophilus ruber]